MSSKFRFRKKRINDFKRVRLRESAQYNRWYLSQIHQIPDIIPYNSEYDFWGFNGKDVYLLRFRNVSENIICKARTNKRAPYYIVLKKEFTKLDTNTIGNFLSIVDDYIHHKFSNPNIPI